MEALSLIALLLTLLIAFSVHHALRTWYRKHENPKVPFEVAFVAVLCIISLMCFLAGILVGILGNAYGSIPINPLEVW